MKNDLCFAAESKWIALLDDDDYFYPDHLASLVEAAEANGSDVAYSWCDVSGANPWLGYNLGNVVKYITRADHKDNKLEDLRKAQWYLTREINSLK